MSAVIRGLMPCILSVPHPETEPGILDLFPDAGYLGVGKGNARGSEINVCHDFRGYYAV